jgi:hypothetical protein
MKSPFAHLIFALIICALACVGYGFSYSILVQKSAAVADLESKIASQTDAINRLTATRAAFGEIAGDEAAVQNYFISESGVVGFIDMLQSSGRAQGAAVDVLSVSADKLSKQPTFTFSISISGSFDAVMRTVGVIEYAPYAVSVSALSVRQDAKNLWHADMIFVAGSLPATTTAPTT